MNTNVKEAYDLLKEYDFIMPYGTAWGFVWTHLACFSDKFRPSYKKHFFPFLKYKERTFFYVDNIVEHLRRQLSDRMIQEAGFPTLSLAVMYVFLVGLSDDEIQEFQWEQWQQVSDGKLDPLLREYNYSHHFVSEIIKFGGEIADDYSRQPMQPEIGVDFDYTPRVHKLKMNRRFFEQYDIPIREDKDNLIVYTIKLID